MVFGPAVDGGCYLVGLPAPSRAVFAIDPARWGGPSVLEASTAAARAAGLTTRWLEPLRDLDTPGHVAAHLASPDLPRAIRRALSDRRLALAR